MAVGARRAGADSARATGPACGGRSSSTRPSSCSSEVKAAEVRGRGGAGFPAGQKWAFTRAAEGDEKFIVANGDEGDPGSYIDKYLMERSPALLLEGMALAGYAVGAEHGFVLTRSEYPLSKPLLEAAASRAREQGWLGTSIAGTGFDFDVTVIEGAGSYVVGEETALLACLQGLRGTVSARPPFPAQRGLHGRPTVVNNVETLCNMPFIAPGGADAYRALSPGARRARSSSASTSASAARASTRCRSGCRSPSCARSSPAGCGTDERSRRFRSAGRSAGSCRPSRMEVAFDFGPLADEGCMLGHGGILAFDDRTDMRAVARHLLHFGADESCGKCFPCRIGLARAHEMFVADEPVDRGRLEDLLEALEVGSLCAHGGGMPAPIRSLLKHYPEELGLA